MPTPEEQTADVSQAATAATTMAAAAEAAESGSARPSRQESGQEGEAIEGEIVMAQTADEAAEPEATETTETETGESEGAQAAEEDGSGPLGAELEMLRKQLDEAQVDIKRVAAEYKNYRERVKRDQAAAAELAVAGVLYTLLPILDDLDRAREHGDLTGPFGSVAEQLLAAVGKFGLTAFGVKGDPFDPNRHEAVAHLPSDEVTEETCVDVMRRGYMLGDRLLRPAMVAVAAPPD